MKDQEPNDTSSNMLEKLCVLKIQEMQQNSLCEKKKS